MPKPRDDETYPERLLALLAMFEREIWQATYALEQKQYNAQDWETRMTQLLMRYIMASVLLGMDANAVTAQAEQVIQEAVRTQVTQYLHPFAQEIAASDSFQASWHNRARMYAESIIAPYWQASTQFLKLPAYPADMTAECGQADRCMWSLDWIGNEADLNVDAYWVDIHDKAECKTCRERGVKWSPLKVRNGEWLNA